MTPGPARDPAQASAAGRETVVRLRLMMMAGNDDEEEDDQFDDENCDMNVIMTTTTHDGARHRATMMTTHTEPEAHSAAGAVILKATQK